MTDTSGNTTIIDSLTPETTLADLKKRYQDTKGVPFEKQEIFFDRTPLNRYDDMTLQQLGIRNGIRLWVITGRRGAPLSNQTTPETTGLLTHNKAVHHNVEYASKEFLGHFELNRFSLCLAHAVLSQEIEDLKNIAIIIERLKTTLPGIPKPQNSVPVTPTPLSPPQENIELKNQVNQLSTQVNQIEKKVETVEKKQAQQDKEAKEKKCIIEEEEKKLKKIMGTPPVHAYFTVLSSSLKELMTAYRTIASAKVDSNEKSITEYTTANLGWVLGLVPGIGNSLKGILMTPINKLATYYESNKRVNAAKEITEYFALVASTDIFFHSLAVNLAVKYEEQFDHGEIADNEEKMKGRAEVDLQHIVTRITEDIESIKRDGKSPLFVKPRNQSDIISLVSSVPFSPLPAAQRNPINNQEATLEQKQKVEKKRTELFVKICQDEIKQYNAKKHGKEKKDSVIRIEQVIKGPPAVSINSLEIVIRDELNKLEKERTKSWFKQISGLQTTLSNILQKFNQQKHTIQAENTVEEKKKIDAEKKTEEKTLYPSSSSSSPMHSSASSNSSSFFSSSSSSAEKTAARLLSPPGGPRPEPLDEKKEEKYATPLKALLENTGISNPDKVIYFLTFFEDKKRVAEMKSLSRTDRQRILDILYKTTEATPEEEKRSTRISDTMRLLPNTVVIEEKNRGTLLAQTVEDVSILHPTM